MNDKGFQDILIGVDLIADRRIGNSFGIVNFGGADVYRQYPIRANHGVSPVKHISSNCSSIRRRLSYSYFPLYGSVSYYGVRPVDLSGKPARHRSMPVGSNIETLPYGHQQIDFSFDSGRYQRIPRLAHLRRIRTEIDRSR
jgi:hypothetical protein